jgi:tRNA (guanosine-2'-O-)-methyltransferase
MSATPATSDLRSLGGPAERVDRTQRQRGSRIVAVELAEDATRRAELKPAREWTVVLLGHEHDGVPEHLWDLIDEVVEIPMVGIGASLNVAGADSLVAHRLASVS